jgi:hypothetical protein
MQGAANNAAMTRAPAKTQPDPPAGAVDTQNDRKRP